MAEHFFPIKGISQSGGYRNQPVGTTPSCSNVRPFDTTEGRLRGGQRPGLIKAYDTQLASGRPVLAMVAINTTYIAV